MRAFAGTISLACIFVLGAGPATAEEGPFGGFDLAVAVSNFDVPTTESNPNIGSLVAAEAGWRLAIGPIDGGLSLGFSGAGFDFPLEVMTQMGPTEIDADVALDMLELSAWLFVPLGDRLELHGQLGGGPTSGQLNAATMNIDKDGWGYLLAVGLAVRLRGSLALVGEGFWRNYGFTIDEFEGFEDDLFSYGATVGVAWRP